MAEISAMLNAELWAWLCAWLQKVWSCCQNETLPKLPIPVDPVALPNRLPARLLMHQRS